MTMTMRMSPWYLARAHARFALRMMIACLMCPIYRIKVRQRRIILYE